MRRILPVLMAAVVWPGAVMAGQAEKPADQRATPLSTDELAEVYSLYLQGRSQADRRDARGAIAAYRKALELAPAAADLRAEMATLLAQTNQIPEARLEARRAIQDDEDNREAHRLLGLIESSVIQQKPAAATPAMFQEAIGHLEYALAGGVSDLTVQLTIAELYLEHGNAERAAAAAQRFLEERPGYPPAVMVLVAALEKSGRSEEVAAAFAELRDEPASDLLALAESLRQGGAARHVVTLLEPRVKSPLPEDIESGAFGPMAAAVGMALRALGEDKRAVALMEDARARKAGGGMLLFSLAAAYEQDGQHAAAERTFRELIAEEPDHHLALNYLGYMLADRGQKLDEAVQLITRALEIDRNNPSYLDSLGWAYYRLRRFDDARDPLERAARALPNVSVIQDHLGDLYLAMKRYGDAAAAFDQALGGDRNDVDVAVVTSKRDRARDLAAKP